MNRLPKKVFQRFVDAGPVLTLGDVAAGISYRLFYFVNRVCRTRWHPGDFAI